MKLVVPPDRRNSGYSLGLQHKYVYGMVLGLWCIWDRNDGRIVWVWRGQFPVLAEHETGVMCHAMNGVPIQPTAEVIADMDSES